MLEYMSSPPSTGRREPFAGCSGAGREAEPTSATSSTPAFGAHRVQLVFSMRPLCWAIRRAPGSVLAARGNSHSFRKGSAPFQTPQTFSAPQKAATLAVGKLTVGGHVSIVVPESGSSNVYFYLGNGAGRFSSRQAARFRATFPSRYCDGRVPATPANSTVLGTLPRFHRRPCKPSLESHSAYQRWPEDVRQGRGQGVCGRCGLRDAG
jgi:hypothetical protein